MSEIVVPKGVRPAAEIAVAITDLMDEARAGGHEALRYFLDIARQEAELTARRETEETSNVSCNISRNRIDLTR